MPTSYLPADDEANGFDNIADVLRVLPIAAGPVPVGIGQDLEPGGGRPVHHSRQPGVSGSAGSRPGAAHRGPAAGHARRHSHPLQLSAGRRIRFPRFSAAEHRRLPDGPGISAPARNQHRRPARVSGAGGRRGRQQDVGRQPGRRQGHHRRAAADAHPGQSRAADRGGDVPAARLRAIRRAAAAVHPRPRSAEHERHPADRPHADHRSVQCHWSGRYAQPPPYIFLPARRMPPRELALRPPDPHEPRAPGLSPSGDRRGSGNPAQLLSIGAQQEEFRSRESRTRCA